PPEFAASPIGKQSVILAHRLEGGRDEVLAFVAVDRPISTDLAEFVRVADLAATRVIREKHDYREVSRLNTTCNGVPGIAIEGRSVGDSGLRYKRRACGLLRNGHGFFFSYLVPEIDAAAREPTLRAIVNATDFQ